MNTPRSLQDLNPDINTESACFTEPTRQAKDTHINASIRR